eukprot:TRINITY_DN7980_c0_g1_i1.p1 TRINITY_DN7980_c0_g1~~TRINITY_DN7980_c0_g1_i1.p1  ORF type:complete len:322 (+),score=28.92 TRINITY_DN7980_c0_g1_i1:156-1121(+)
MSSFQIFLQIIEVVNIRQDNPKSITEFLDAVVNEKVPPPGKSIEFKCRSPKGVLEKYKFSRRPDSDRLIETLNYDVAFQYLSTSNLMGLFANMLNERRIIFTSTNVTVLSAVVRSLVGILYPFSWVHVYIPVIPKTMLNYCCAPMPFLLGVMSNHMKDVNSMSRFMDEHVLFDIDKNTFIKQPFQDVQTLPDHATILMRSLNTLNPHSSFMFSFGRKRSSDLNTSVANVFLNFFLEVLKGYRQYFDPNTSAAFRFQRNKFIDDQNNASMKKFLGMFLKTQMFEVFIHHRVQDETDDSESIFEMSLNELEAVQKKTQPHKKS